MKTFKTRLKIFIISCIMIFSFTSCKKNNYYQLAPEDLAWMVYSDGDVIKFKNDTGAILTFKTDYNTRTYSITGGDYYEHTGIRISMANDTAGLSGLLYVEKQGDGTLVTLSWPHYYGTLYISSEVTITKTIGAHVYTDLYVGNSADVSGVYSIKSFYYSKTAGMVQFTTRDSFTWNKTN
ncbi:MAG: hypothetical protein ABI855_02030 [Bacteroidota bacterium]